MRIKVMSAALGHEINLIKTSGIVVSGTFVAALTPASIGGEPLRIHLLRKDKMPLGQATAIVMSESLLDTVIMLSYTETHFKTEEKYFDLYRFQRGRA